MSQSKPKGTSLKFCPECRGEIRTDTRNELFCEKCGLVIFESSQLSPFADDGFGLLDEGHHLNKDGEADTHPSQSSDKNDESASVENRRRRKARQTETLEQIVGTIIEEHKVMKPGQILQYIEKYLPEGWEKPNDDKVRRAFNTYKKNISNRIFFTSIGNDLYKGHIFSEETLNKSRQKREMRPVIGARKESSLIPKDASFKFPGTWSNPDLSSARPKKSSSIKAPQKTRKQKKT